MRLIALLQKHADIILAQDVLEYGPLFTEIADAYFEREMYLEARHIYELLGGDAGVIVFRCAWLYALTGAASVTHRRAACMC